MLYQFPPPDWFEVGTTSYLVLLICLWGIVIGVPASVLVCLTFPPRSRLVWILAELFWIMASLLMPAFLFASHISLSPTRGDGVPGFLAFAAGAVLILFPVPAAIAGVNELVPRNDTPRGFQDLRTWGCTFPIATLVLLWLMQPSLIHPAEVERRTLCKNNLKQIGLAMHNYHDAFAKFPDARTHFAESPPVSWRVSILPYIEHKKPSVEYDPAAPWNSDENSRVAQSDVGLYACPSVPIPKDPVGRYYSAYATLMGPGAPFDGGRGKSIREIADGTSNTALVVEACGQQIVWTEPRDIEVSKDNLGFNLPGKKLGQSPATWSSYHRGGANTLLADGSVRFLNADTDPRILRAITTASGKELLEL